MKKLMTIFGVCLFVFALASCDGNKKEIITKDSKSADTSDGDTKDSKSGDATNNCIKIVLAQMNEEERPPFSEALNIPSNKDMADCICGELPSMTDKEMKEYLDSELEKGSPEQEKQMNILSKCMGFDSPEEFISAITQWQDDMKNMQ